MKHNYYLINLNKNILTSLKQRRTDKPSIISNDKSNKLAVTMIMSNMFQPQLKNSLLRAINLKRHSTVKIVVKT